MNFLRRLALQEKKLDDSSRLDVVEIARVPDMLQGLFPYWSGLRTYQHPGIQDRAYANGFPVLVGDRQMFLCQRILLQIKCNLHFSGVGGGVFYRQTAPDLKFGIFICFELGEGFEVDAALPSPSPENVADGVLSIYGQSGSSGTACLSVCTEPQFCHPPGMQGAPSLCISRTGIIKIIRSWNNAFDGFRRISIIAIRNTNERT